MESTISSEQEKHSDLIEIKALSITSQTNSTTYSLLYTQEIRAYNNEFWVIAYN